MECYSTFSSDINSICLTGGIDWALAFSVMELGTQISPATTQLIFCGGNWATVLIVGRCSDSFDFLPWDRYYGYKQLYLLTYLGAGKGSLLRKHYHDIMQAQFLNKDFKQASYRSDLFSLVRR